MALHFITTIIIQQQSSPVQQPRKTHSKNIKNKGNTLHSNVLLVPILFALHKAIVRQRALNKTAPMQIRTTLIP